MSKRMNQVNKVPEDIQALLDATPRHPEFLEQMKRDITELDKQPAAVADYLKMQLVEDILAAMKSNNVGRAELARRLGKSRQYVSRVLNEHTNFTLDSIANIACALEMKVTARIHPSDKRVAILPQLSKPHPVELQSGFVKQATSSMDSTREINGNNIAA